jgi:hypothetical protein
VQNAAECDGGDFEDQFGWCGRGGLLGELYSDRRSISGQPAIYHTGWRDDKHAPCPGLSIGHRQSLI